MAKAQIKKQSSSPKKKVRFDQVKAYFDLFEWHFINYEQTLVIRVDRWRSNKSKCYRQCYFQAGFVISEDFLIAWWQVF